MINKKQFVNMMNAAEAFNKETERWNDFGIELYELPIRDIPWEMFDCWVDSVFNHDGKDWIDWYLWERISVFTNEILPCYDENGVKFYVNTPEDLWKLVEQHQLDYSVESDTKSNIS